MKTPEVNATLNARLGMIVVIVLVIVISLAITLFFLVGELLLPITANTIIIELFTDSWSA